MKQLFTTLIFTATVVATQATESATTEPLKTAPSNLPEAFQSLDWTKESAAGNAAKGRRLFQFRACASCHSTRDGDAGTAGPSLRNVGERLNATQLVEAILLPEKDVTPEFQWSTVTLMDGDTVSGLVVGQSPTELQVELPGGVRKKIPTSQVTDRKLNSGSAMPNGLIRKPEELRDLLAFLLTLRETNTPKPAE